MVTSEVMAASESFSEAGDIKPREPAYSSGKPGEMPTFIEQLVYSYVALDGWEPVQAASTIGVPLEKIAECRQRVQDWLVETMPRTRLSLADQRTAIEKLALDRLEHLYGQAMSAWTVSRQEQSITKMPLSAPSQRVSTIRAGNGHAPLLTAAARITIIMTTFQLRCLAAREKTAEQQANKDFQASEHARASVGRGTIPEQTSPDRDCSPARGEQAAPAVEPARIDNVSHEVTIGCDDTSAVIPGLLASETACARPAQSMSAGGGRGAVGWESVVGGQESETKPRPKPK